ncbi:MAG: ABC transporter ATP-binding protein [Candidatus Izemoplasmatales bacterium]|nr:ABC transporter ATP-binding protein [Candidatus Izemoplasmatales bacterium]MDY0139597.1 ABC transporter ATP-binding protein [Candidatus Izemoplasmatales bacterium]
MSIIRLKNLSKNFKERKAVDNLSLDIEKGEFFALLGFNGAGKTTTIKMLTGLLEPSSGDAYIDGMSIVSDMDNIKPILNISPQETAVAPNLSVYDNLVFIAKIYGFSDLEAREKASSMLKKFNLDSRKKDKAKKLSGGLMRRLSIAMALITEPKIVFLDEPTLGLDVRARRELWYILKGLKGEVTVLLTTHYLEEVEALSDRIAIIDNGKLKIVGTIEQLKEKTGLEKLEDIFLSLTEGDKIL